MRDPTGHEVDYNPGEPPEFDEDTALMQQIVDELHDINGYLGVIAATLKALIKEPTFTSIIRSQLSVTICPSRFGRMR